MYSKMKMIFAAYQRVLVLSVAAFVFNTTEFIPVAMLSDIGAGFQLPVSETGVMITVYAWLVSLSSLPMMLFTAKVERRSLLLALFGVFALGHALSALAWSFSVLLVSRLIIALTHAIFWAITASLVMRVAPRGKRQQALGWLSLGTAMATVLGLPLGRVVGQLMGWRATFALIGIAAAGVLLLLYKVLPRLESKNAGSLASLPMLVKRPLLLGVYALTITAVMAHFTAYSYIEPYVLDITRMSPQLTTGVLLEFGVSGMAGSVLFSRFYLPHPNLFLKISVVVLLLSLLLLQPLGSSTGAMFALVFVWGVGISCLSLSMVAHVMCYAPDATDVATAIYSGSYNVGIGGGALLGGVVMRHFGLTALGWTGALLAAAALGIFVWTQAAFHETGLIKNKH